MSTAAAISTPDSPGGIAVIRISGEDALKVAAKVFRPFGKDDVMSMKGYTCAYGIAHDGDERLDDCVLTVFRSPHSYTGEDVCEISCHGGIYVTRRILRTILKNGAEPAGPGEFTKRAFLNGKLDLTQAEAVMDIISAKGERELKMAEELCQGAAFKVAKKCSEKLLGMLAGLAAWADYPDEDIPEVQPENLLSGLEEVRGSLGKLIAGYDSGRLIREGIPTVIAGKPNVGKSTLFNYLAGCERSIVTDIAGTTRDAIEETVRLGDIVLRLSDTAGIRETDDVIEGIGVGIAERMIDSAELVIAMFDGSRELSDEDIRLINNINNKNSIAVINKTDKEQLLDVSRLNKKFTKCVYMSAKDGSGIDELTAAIEDIFHLNELSLNSASVTNERQKQCVDSALSSINAAIDSLKGGELLDAVNVLIDDAESYLLSLTGERITEAVVDEVFSKFCVGK